MSASPSNTTGTEMKSLEYLDVEKIDRNPANPRLHFTEDELERLAESISKEGMLVPVVVYPEDDGYRLIDGERRWLVAQRLGIERIPAVLTDPPDKRENLIRMFNVHMVREAWQDMPTAWALEKLIEETGVTSDRELADMSGLSTEVIRRLRHALELPTEYQRYIDEGVIPLNFFWELKRNVIDPLARRRPSVWQEFKDNEVLDAFVNKRLGGAVSDVVSLRNVLQIIKYAEREVEDPADSSVLDDTIRELIRNPEATIDEAYQDTVEVIVEADKLERRTDNMVKSFERLMGKVRNKEEREHVQRVGRALVERIGKLIS
jgi:ParB family chromosome partitioning protein